MHDEQKQLKTNETTTDSNRPIQQAAESVPAAPDPDGIKRYKEAVREALEREYYEFLYSESMGSWKSWKWAGQIAKEIGLSEEQQTVVQKEVYEELATEADPTEWNIFLHGTPEEKRSLQAEIAFDLYGPDPYEEPGA